MNENSFDSSLLLRKASDLRKGACTIWCMPKRLMVENNLCKLARKRKHLKWSNASHSFYGPRTRIRDEDMLETGIQKRTPRLLWKHAMSGINTYLLGSCLLQHSSGFPGSGTGLNQIVDNDHVSSDRISLLDSDVTFVSVAYLSTNDLRIIRKLSSKPLCGSIVRKRNRDVLSH